MPLTVGQRVRVKDNYGTVRFIGKTKFAPGVWVGVELEDEVGRNDGSVEGIRYFETSKSGMYGVFVREKMVSQDGTEGVALHHDDVLLLHGIIEKLQLKLKITTGDIKEYKEKISTLESLLQESNTNFQSLESKLEQIGVDKDFMEEKNNELQMSLESIQIKYDDLKGDFQLLQEEFTLNKQIEEEVKESLKHGDYSEENVKVLLERNLQLEHALVSLKSLTDQNEFNLKKELDSLKKNNGLLQKDDETYLAVVEKLSAAEKRIVELQEYLDSALDLEKIIDSLQAKNEELTQKVEQLSSTVEELTELHELDKNLEENQILVEKELNQNIKDLKEIIHNDKNSINKLEKTNKFLESKLAELKSLTKDSKSPEDESLKEEIKRLSNKLKHTDMENLNNKIQLVIAEQQLLFAQNTSLSINETSTILDVIYNLKQAKSRADSILKCLSILQSYELYPGRLFYIAVYKLRQFSAEARFFIPLWEWNYENVEFGNVADKFNSVVIGISETLNVVENRFKDNVYGKLDIESIDGYIDQLHLILNIKKYFKEGMANFYFGLFYYKYILESLLLNGQMNMTILEEIKSKFLLLFEGKVAFRKFSLSFEELLQKWKTGIEPELKNRLKTIENDIGNDYTMELDCLRYENFGIEDTLSILDIYNEIESGIAIDDSLENDTRQLLEKVQNNIEQTLTMLKFEFKLRKILQPIIYDQLQKNNLKSNNAEDIDLLKDNLESMRLRSIEKDRLIDELTINVSLLKNNLSLEHGKNKSYLESLNNELSKINEEKILLETKYSDLLKENNSLKLEIQNLIKSNQIFESGHLKKYNDILSEKSYSANLTLIEEIIFLKKIIKMNSKKLAMIDDELEWLKQPLTPSDEKSINCNSLNFYNLSNHLRQISVQASIFDSVTDNNRWKTLHTSQKLVNAALGEDISKYNNLKSTILSSSLN